MVKQEPENEIQTEAGIVPAVVKRPVFRRRSLPMGNSTLKVASSIIGGLYNANTGPDSRGLTFLIFGADAACRFKDILRVQAEFAQRETERRWRPLGRILLRGCIEQ